MSDCMFKDISRFIHFCDDSMRTPLANWHEIYIFACKNGTHHWVQFFVFEDAGMCSSVFDCNSWFVTQLGWHELVECAKMDSENGNFTNWDDPWNTKLHVISKAYKDTKKLARTILIHVLVIGNLQWWFLAVLEPWSEDLANLTPLFESKNPAFLWNVLATKSMALYPPGCIWSHHEPIRHGYVIEFGSHDQEI